MNDNKELLKRDIDALPDSYLDTQYINKILDDTKKDLTKINEKQPEFTSWLLKFHKNYSNVINAILIFIKHYNSLYNKSFNEISNEEKTKLINVLLLLATSIQTNAKYGNAIIVYLLGHFDSSFSSDASKINETISKKRKDIDNLTTNLTQAIKSLEQNKSNLNNLNKDTFIKSFNDLLGLYLEITKKYDDFILFLDETIKSRLSMLYKTNVSSNGFEKSNIEPITIKIGNNEIMTINQVLYPNYILYWQNGKEYKNQKNTWISQYNLENDKTKYTLLLKEIPLYTSIKSQTNRKDYDSKIFELSLSEFLWGDLY